MRVRGRVFEDQLYYLIFGEIGRDDEETWSRARWWGMWCWCLGIELIDSWNARITTADVDDYKATMRGGDYRCDCLQYGSEVATRRESWNGGIKGEVEIGIEEKCIIIGEATEVVGPEAG